MEDFKIVLYVLAAFAWMIYKNYEKIKKDTASRDLSKPVDSQKTETPYVPPVLPKPSPLKRPIASPSPSRKPPISATEKRKTLVRPALTSRSRGYVESSPSIEGGLIKPSASVQFEEIELETQSLHNPIAEQIRNADFRQAIVLSEILQRPYS
ncbi:MAG: hypothetical protein ACKPAD_06565 [Bacteroidota bacterium]